MLSSNDKLRIIHNWCDDLVLRDTYDKWILGVIWIGNRRIVTHHCGSFEEAINDAYGLLEERAWGEVNDH